MKISMIGWDVYPVTLGPYLFDRSLLHCEIGIYELPNVGCDAAVCSYSFIKASKGLSARS